MKIYTWQCLLVTLCHCILAYHKNTVYKPVGNCMLLGKKKDESNSTAWQQKSRSAYSYMHDFLPHI